MNRIPRTVIVEIIPCLGIILLYIIDTVIWYTNCSTETHLFKSFESSRILYYYSVVVSDIAGILYYYSVVVSDIAGISWQFSVYHVELMFP